MVYKNNFKQILILKIQAAVAPFLSCNFKSKPIKFADQYTHLHTLSFQQLQFHGSQHVNIKFKKQWPALLGFILF